MSMKLVLVLGSACLVSACATTDDPREGGFVSGVQGLSSGTYERRVRDREDNLARLRAVQDDLKQETTGLDAQKQQRQKLLDEEQRKLASLNKDVKALEKKLAALSKEQGTSDKRVAELDKRLRELKGQLSKQGSALDALEGGGVGSADALEGSGAGVDTRRQQLEAQRLALQKEYEELLNLTLMLAQ